MSPLPLFLCSDFDGTLAPYGDLEVSPEAYAIFKKFYNSYPVTLAIITGRTPQSALAALRECDLPLPHFLVGDVGSTLLVQQDKEWVRSTAWDETIARDWAGSSAECIMERLRQVPGLEPQESEFQTAGKVCFYADINGDGPHLVNRVRTVLLELRVRSQVLWSRDTVMGRAYLDVLPQSAGKLGAMRFLQSRFGFDPERTVYCGDAGNDIDALASGVRAILPRNAYPEVRRDAEQVLRRRQQIERLYQARGGFLGTNGNALGGVLEGLVHHFPDLWQWMQ